MKTELVMEVAEVITAQDTARSLWIIYQQMPVAVQRVFKEMLDDDDASRMRMTEEVLRDDWESPENDIWDELYAKQNA